MLRSYVPLGAALAICLATAGCMAPSNDETAGVSEPEPEIEEELSFSVDALDIRHGTLRIEASMTDGSADVSMWLGPTCATREVGHGFATRSGFAWSLSGDEIARAIECSLVVRVRAIDDEGHRVRRTGQLPVAVSLVPDGAEEVLFVRQESSGEATKMTFAAKTRAARVHIAGSVIGAELEEDDAPRPKGLYLSSFLVGNDDLARAMIGRRHLTLHGEPFLPTITVGSMTVDVSEPEPESPSVEVVDIETTKSSETEGEYYEPPTYDYSYGDDYYYGEG